MEQSSLLDTDLYDGRRFVERFAADGNPVTTAFWAKTAEDGTWFLYVATELVERQGPIAAYRAVHAALDKIDYSSITSSNVKVINTLNPMVKDVLALGQKVGRFAARFGHQRIGMLEVDELYVYAPSVYDRTGANPMTTEDIGREIIRLMNRGPGTLQPSRIDLKNGTGFEGIPFSLEAGGQGEVIARFIADGEAFPKAIKLDEITSIS